MNAGMMQLPGAQPGASMLTLLPVGAGIGRRHPVILAAVFVAIALTGLLVGVLIPKRYTASTSILVEQSNIIGPLMEGRAVPTDVANRAMIARDVAFSRRVMNDILKAGGWLADNPDPVTRDRLTEQIKNRTSIISPGGNLIRITYTDSDPERAFLVTRRFGDLIIRESLATKERESRDAYDFINSQVAQYHRKLTQAEEKLKAYRQSNPDALPGVTADVSSRI